MINKKALIFGITGQDGAYLSKLLMIIIIRFLGLLDLKIKKYS